MLVGFWAWIFAGGPEKANPDYLVGPRVRSVGPGSVRGAPTAASTPSSRHATPPPPTERADVIDQASDELTLLVDDLEARAPTSRRRRRADAGLDQDWRTWIRDRRRYTAALRTDPRAQFLVSTNQAGDSVDRPIKNFADINDIPECDPPLDVG